MGSYTVKRARCPGPFMSYGIRRRKNQSGGTIKEKKGVKKGVAAYLTNLWSNVKAQQKRKLN